MKKDLNFLLPFEHAKPSLRRILLVFIVSFALLVGILQSPGLISQAKHKVTFDQDKEYERITEHYRDLYGYHGSTQTPLPSTPSPSQAQGNVLKIGKINIEAPIIEPTTANEADITNILKQGVVIYPGTSKPGQSGTTVIVGHSSSDLPWTKYSNVFSLLSRLVNDDLITIQYQGKTYTYSVITRQTGSLNEIQALASKINLGDLVLSSCWPVGSDTGRILIGAKLIEVR